MRHSISLAVICLTLMTVGCGHYRGALPLQDPLRATLGGKLVVGGILDRRSPHPAPAIAERATKMLANATHAPDRSGRLDAGDLSFLLSTPAELTMEPARLEELRQRLGCRYVVVGEEGADQVTHLFVWDSLWVIPFPGGAVWFTVPMTLSRNANAHRATRVLRVVDLQTASIVGESYELLRSEPEGGEFSAGEIADGLAAMRISNP